MRNIVMSWDTGGMRIELTSFFPCTIKKFKDLLRVIDKSKNSTENRSMIKSYCVGMHSYYCREQKVSTAFCQILEGNIDVLEDCLAVDDNFEFERLLLLKDLKEQRKRFRTERANLSRYTSNVRRFERYLSILNPVSK